MRERFIKELKEQIYQNQGNLNTKINIHLPLRGKITQYCIELNERINEITKNEIDFSPHSFHNPHLTLSMGYIQNEYNYTSLLQELYTFATEMKTFEIEVTNPYLKRPKNNYIFLDTKQSNHIINIKRQLEKQISNLIEPLNWDVVNETPHITIGYIKNANQKINDLLNSYPTGPNWIADSLEISFSGPWGSCLGSIRTFEF